MDGSESTKTPANVTNMADDQGGGVTVHPTPTAANLTLEATASPSAPSVDDGTWVTVVVVAALLVVVMTLMALTSVWVAKEMWKRKRRCPRPQEDDEALGLLEEGRGSPRTRETRPPE
nr:uncharacterized protein LOC113804739 [Penaeus vannamei]